MAVVLRLRRIGRKNRPSYRITAVDKRRAAKTGCFIEELGHYDPLCKQEDKQLVFKKERVEHWLKVGAIPSETLHGLLRRSGMLSGPYRPTLVKKK